MTFFLLPLLLSEVLANEPGSVTSLEFVELMARQPVREGSVTFNANGSPVVVPGVPLDSGDYLVICRDVTRFEQHFGDSSGVWGDDDRENYPLQEFGFSLPNSAGYVELATGTDVDRFEWTGQANDGVSYERVSVSLWQTTRSPSGSTPGHRNHGAAPDFDWSIEHVAIQPPLPNSGEAAELRVRIRNLGQYVSSGWLMIIHPSVDTVLKQEYSGVPGEVVEMSVSIIPHAGVNAVAVALSIDDRPENSQMQWQFQADSGPLVLSEVYHAPDAGEPEWLEIYCPSGFVFDLQGLSIADLADTAGVGVQPNPPSTSLFLILTEDSLLFSMTFPDVPALIVQPHGWPSLNNTGDTIVLLLHGVGIDRVAVPSAGSRRGIAYERVGTSQVWGWSVAQSGATPGGPNSLDVSYSSAIVVDVSPNPFAAGLGEQTRVQYQVPFGAVGELRLFRGDGRPVRTLFDRRPVVSGECFWDGFADAGDRVPVGIYIVRFKLFEPTEQVHLSTVVVAR